MKKLGYISIFLSVTIWSLAFVSSKVVLEVMPPMSIVFFRYIFANIFFIILMTIRKQSFRVERKDIPLFLSSALIGITLYFVFELAGLQRLQASTSTLILALIPLVIIFVNRFTKTEKLSNTKRLAVVGSIIGVGMVVGSETSGNDLLGYLLMFGAVLAWVVFSFQTSKLTQKYDETKIAAVHSLVALVSFTPLFLMEDVDYTIIEPIHWMNIMFLGVISSAIGFALYNFALKTIGGTVSSLVINFIPVITLGFGYIFLNETMTLIQIAGGVLIMGFMTLTILDDFNVVIRKEH